MICMHTYIARAKTCIYIYIYIYADIYTHTYAMYMLQDVSDDRAAYEIHFEHPWPESKHVYIYIYTHTYAMYMLQVVRDDRAAYEIQFEQAQQEAKAKRNAAAASGSSLDEAT